MPHVVQAWVSIPLTQDPQLRSRKLPEFCQQAPTASKQLLWRERDKRE